MRKIAPNLLSLSLISSEEEFYYDIDFNKTTIQALLSLSLYFSPNLFSHSAPPFTVLQIQIQKCQKSQNQ